MNGDFGKRVALAALLAATMTMAGAAFAGPDTPTTAGRGYGEWAAAWWQWLTSVPAAENPQTVGGAVDCTVHQGGPVWFLAGAPLGQSFERSCTVEAYTPLFFPLLNGIFTNGPGESFTVAEKREAMDGVFSDLVPGPFQSRACELHVTLDGANVLHDEAIARVQSPAFLVDTGDGGSGLPANVVDAEAITDGYWAMISGLAPGTHTLRFGGALCEFDGTGHVIPPVDVTYALTVVE